jgi:aspartate-semialdehyde dehydrogenase
MQTKLPVGILGGWGIVGQRFVQMLSITPVRVAWLAASDRSGKSYEEQHAGG